jgi:UDP-3-O-[3-hydroxymyristoyl] glucosamine N-acyltransferase
MAFTAGEIAETLQGQVIGDASVVLTGFAPASTAKAGDLTFAENSTYLARAEQTAATAILVDGEYASEKKVIIRVANARVAFARALALFFPEPPATSGIHPSAVIDATAQIDPTAHIGPCCVVGRQVRIGARVVLQGGNHVGDQCQLGEGTHLFPNVVLYPRTQIGRNVRVHAGTVIGSDGFGYVFDQGAHRKVPQAGNVIIHDDVEIGANVTIDRGTLGPTVIGRGTKIDNLVMIGHNVILGENCLLIAQVGVAGSTKLGNFVILAGQVGLAGHLKIGDRVTVAAQSGVMNDIGEGEKWMGSPARPDRQMKRQLVAGHQLPDVIRRVQELERQVAALSGESETLVKNTAETQKQD